MTRLRSTTTQLAFASILLLLASGCSELTGEQGSGVPETVTYSFDDFDGIDIGGAFQLQARAGEAFSVEITVDDNYVDDLNVEVKSSTLHIGFDRGFRDHSVEPTAVITAPSLDHLDVSGASTAVVTAVKGTSFELDVSGASVASIEADTDQLELDLSGSSELTYRGAAIRSEMDLSGSSNADFAEATLDRVELDVSGASNVEFGAIETVIGDISGASNVQVDQDTNVSVDLSGASEITRRS